MATNSHLLFAAIVGSDPASMGLMQRHIGGILSGIAEVRCYHSRAIDNVNADMYICAAHGEQYELVRQSIANRPVLDAEFALLPIAIRSLRAIPKNLTLGVLARHRQCANYLLCEIIRAGIADYRFLAGTYEEMDSMPVDRFIAVEDKKALVERYKPKKEVIYIARGIAPISAAEIINTALKLASR